MGFFGQATTVNSTYLLQRALEASSSYLTGHGIDKLSGISTAIAAVIALLAISGWMGIGQGLDEMEPPLLKSWISFGIGHLIGVFWGQIGYLEKLQYVIFPIIAIFSYIRTYIVSIG
jgi:hypothetical protein